MYRFLFVVAFHLALVFNGCGVKKATTSQTHSNQPVEGTDSSNAATSLASSVVSPEVVSNDFTKANETPSSVVKGNTGMPGSNEKLKPTNSASDAKTSERNKVPESQRAGIDQSEQAKKHAAPTPEQLTKWAVADYQPMQLLACYDGFGDSLVDAMAVSPDGKQFVLGGVRLTMWNTNEAKPVVDLIEKFKSNEVERPIRSAAISPDGNWLAAGDTNGRLRIWNMRDQHEVVSIQAHDARLTELSFSPNAEMLATTSYSGEVRLWQTADGKKIKSLKMGDQEIARLVFLSDKFLASSGAEVNIWNIETEKKETILSTGYVMGPTLGISSDLRLFAFSDADSQIHFWDIEKKSSIAPAALRDSASHAVEFSHDGKWLATCANDSTIRIWDAARHQTLQVIDADGGRTTDIRWLPQGQLLLVASQRGRVRLWGTPESAALIGVKPMELASLKPIPPDTRKPYSSARAQKVIDVRSFPRLPDAQLQWSGYGMAAYTTSSSQKEAETFYRYHLERTGWTETTTSNQLQPGLSFNKEQSVLFATFTPMAATKAGGKEELQVSLNFAGNYDVRWLPKFQAIESIGNYESFSSASYRTKSDLTDIEVGLLKQFHDAGWTAYSRLAASTTEVPQSRTFFMLQSGNQLTVSIGPPADLLDELYVQTSVSISNKSLPIPPDAGWIEFDSSTDLKLVANTQMNLDESIEFFDSEMVSEGWMAREAERYVKDGKGWLPYIRGQQDVLIRLVTLPDKRTRIIVGDAESTSWQLAKPPTVDLEKEKNGIQAADFPIPQGAKSLKFELDQKQILFDLNDVTPPVVADQVTELLKAIDFQREKSGVVSDDYVLATFTKGKAEIQIRARLVDGKHTSSIISGDELLWTKPLPAPPVRVSYEAWLRRDRRDTTLDRLDEFVEEMRKIPAGNGTQ